MRSAANGMPRPARLTAVLLAACLALAFLPSTMPSASSASAVRVLGTGRVTAVADGDTIWVNLAGDGTKRPVRVRLAGIQATETRHSNLNNSRNWCHGVQAAKALRKLVQNRRVQLRGVRADSRSLGRPLRYVFVRSGGRWVDVQRILLQQGHVMSLTLENENTNDAAYGLLAQRAATTGRGLWNTTTCGAGPQQSVPLRTWVHWDAEGNDGQNPNGEYVVVENRSATETLNLGGWMVRDTSQAWYRFPSSARIAPNSFVRLFVGRGTDSAQAFHWNLGKPLFSNPSDAPGTTEFAVLMDPRGDFRSWATYPCRITCADPLLGKVRVTGVLADVPGDDNRFVNGEWARLTNTSPSAVRLSGYYVAFGPYLTYTFSPTRVLGAGETLTVRMGRGEATADTVYLGSDRSRLSNTGGTAELRSWGGKRLSCLAWGASRC